MLTVRAVPAVVMLQVVLLLALGVPLRRGAAGWAVAFVSLVVVAIASAHLARINDMITLGPADVVTTIRVALTCAIVPFVVQPDPGSSHVTAVATLGAVALALDRVDGWVARSTGTASAFGARFDGEADAFLLLVLSVWVAPSFGWWVLAIGLARYVFAVAGWVLPWLRAQLPFRYWRKVVTASAGTALVVAAADVVPDLLASTGLVVGLALIAESFGRDVWWLWSHASVRRPQPAVGGPA